MGDDEKKKKIKEDPRSVFFGNYLMKTMMIKSDKIAKMLSVEENKETINYFCQHNDCELLVFMINQAGVLSPMLNFPPSPKGKCSYFIRHSQIPMTLENMNKVLLFGDLSAKPIDDLAILVDDVIFPVLNNPLNQKGWPNTIRKSVNSAIQELRNIVAEVRGNMMNRTLLPLPITIEPLMRIASRSHPDNFDIDNEMIISLELIVIKWCDQLADVFNESCELLFVDRYPTPNDEIDYWNFRLQNLENIFEQIRDVKIRTIAMALEKVDSFYFTSFQSMFRKLVVALNEARDITLFLNPFRKRLDEFEQTDFEDALPLIDPLYHVLCLIWKHSNFFSSNYHQAHIFRMISNMIINEATKCIDPFSIFQGEAGESLVKMNKIIEIVDYFLNQYFKHHDELTKFKPRQEVDFLTPASDRTIVFWTFRHEDVFERLFRYRTRIYQIRDIFTIANEFLKLDRVEIGGINGKNIKRRLMEINDEFNEAFKIWRNATYDACDPDPHMPQFHHDLEKFNQDVDVLERKLAFQFNLAFNECHTVDHATKLIQVLTTLLQRPVIQEEIESRYSDVIELYEKELDVIKATFDYGLYNIEKTNDLSAIPIDLAFPPFSGAVQWVLKLRERVDQPISDFECIEYPIFDIETGQYALARANEMTDLLTGFEQQLFDKWTPQCSADIAANLKKPLLTRATDSKLIAVNFDFVLVTALRDIKNLKLLKIDTLTADLMEFSDKEEYYWDIRLKLSRVVEWYNYLYESLEKCEIDILTAEIEEFDETLSTALTIQDWEHVDLVYLKTCYTTIQQLYDRVIKTQANKHSIINSIRSWGSVPLYVREGKNGLLNIDDRNTFVSRRLLDCEETTVLIKLVMDENFRLFFNIIPESDGGAEEEEEEEVEAEEEIRNDDDPMNFLGVPPEHADLDQLNEGLLDEGIGDDFVAEETGEEQMEEEGETEEDLEKKPSGLGRTPEQIWLFRPYEEYLDGLVGKEIVAAIMTSMRYIKNELENVFKTNSPLFEVKCELIEPDMVFIPSLLDGTDHSLMERFELIITDLYSMAFVIPRIAQPLKTDDEEDENNTLNISKIAESYITVVDGDSDTDSIRTDAYMIVKVTTKEAQDFYRKYENFNYLWTIDRQEYLELFLKYNQALTPEQIRQLQAQEITMKEKYPSLDKFRERIDFYTALQQDVEKFENAHTFRIWLRVNFRAFKQSLINHVIKWASLFKVYLISKVVDGLQELEDFIKESTDILSRELDKEDLEALLDVMSILKRIEDRKVETDNMFEPLHEIVEMLKNYDYEIDEKIANQFVDLPDQWNRLKKLSMNVKQKIVPIQKYQADLIIKRISLFNNRMRIYREKFRNLPFFYAPCKNPYQLIDKSYSELEMMQAQMDKLTESSSLFELDPPDLSKLQMCFENLVLLKSLWDLVLIIDSSVESWQKTAWKKINVESMDQYCKNFTKDLRMLDKSLRTWYPYTYAESKLKNLMTSLRAIVELQNPAIRDRHWLELMEETKVRFEMDDNTTLSDLVALNLHNFEEEVKNIVEKSVKELAMEKAIDVITAIWKTLSFDFDTHDRTKLKILRQTEDLTEILEDHQQQLQNMISSKYIAYFFDIVSEWQLKLSHVDQVLTAWFEVQRKWTYLESIFIGSEDIRSQLPQDSARFDRIDTEFKGLLGKIQENTNVIVATHTENLLPTLERLQRDLILCEKALNDYLETKRLSYPRFYFVSSADLLDILSNGNYPPLVCRHLTKLYDSLARLEFNSATAGKSATEMVSKEHDEHVKFIRTCDCSGKVEIWLNRVTESMRETLRDLFSKAVAAYENTAREKLIMDTAAQPALCTTQIWWTAEVNAAFKFLSEGYENALKDYNRKQIGQLNALINLLLGDLSSGDRQKIMTVCTIDVHSRDVVGKMIAQKVESVFAFQWQSQLRHRWDQKLNNCFANICDAQFRYDYEYLGNTPRLVITPLTDRCYITLTQSLHLIMGGAPAGPAGTGKTETTKDLGRALGIMVYVFNCSEQMDYRSCGNIYKGLAQTGAWGCFDEFNRIAVEVLSVVSVQVKSILDAIKSQKRIFNFMGEQIRLIPTIGMFITMNPGYAGRTELPENLKALFRPCAMVVPDFALICEIMLVAEGFQEARLLARKFITLYTLCKELLSKQDHYDWGLRAIKSVLVVAGSLRRGDRMRPEDQVLMRALRDFNIPKIVTDDVPIFMGLIGDLFPALDVPRKRDLEFEATIKKSSVDLNLQPDDGFILKVVQLEELFAVRHSVFINGFAGTGKTQVWKTLFKTYQNQGRKPHFNDLNPKSVTNDELFGAVNASTREWKDGLFSVIMRDQANMGGTGPKWIVLDGDIDPMWIESLNTLMDDNKVLTLASNERIALTKEMRLLFEIATLRTATPATVSRAGILYINPQDLGWSPFVLSWVDTRTSQPERNLLTVLFDKYIPTLLEVSKTRFKKITPVSEIAMIQMTCHLLECLLVPENVPFECPKEWYEIYFVFAVIWGFGSCLFQDQIIDWRSEFNKWWLSEFKTIKFPSAGTIFNYFIDKETKKFLPWTELLPTFELDPDIPLQTTLVHTAETIRLRYFMDILIEKNHPVMLVGGAGSGKSVIVADKLNSLVDRYLITNVPFNFYTTSQMLQNVLEKPLEKKAGKNYAPPGSKTMIYFIDDMNMPEVDKYGTVQPHTLVRQYMDYKHWYDREKLTLKDIMNCQFVSCMNPTAGSFTIDPRLQRHFCSFAVNFPGPDALYHIYFSILSQHLSAPYNKFDPVLVKYSAEVVNVAVLLHTKMGQTFLPTAVKFHYVFNLRDMANIFQGMMFSNGETVKNEQTLFRLYVHEATRVYHDKLVNHHDIETFNQLIKEVTKRGFETMNDEKVFKKPLIFCHFAESLVDQKYLSVREWSVLSKLLDECQKNYNDMVGAMNLVLFEDAMSHICRINRILEAPRGYALLIGVGGSGKQSLTRMAAFISNLDVFQVQLRKGYGIADLRDDLSKLYLKAGVRNQPCAYLMTDSQVAEEIFLVLINDLLASGEIPDLFADDDIDNIIGAIRNEVKQAGIFDNKENCWKFFIDKVRRTLKVILCFSPVGATLRIRARKFPALVNCTSINWFHKWPQEALISVSSNFLSFVEDLPEQLRPSVSNFMAYVHGTVNDMSYVYLQNEKRYNYTTPKSFLELIALYSKLLTEKVMAIKDRIIRLENGLLKLEACASQVDSLQDVLKEQEVILKEKNDAADKLIVVVGAENEKVQKEKNFAAEEEKKVRIIEEDVSAKAKLCEEDLRKAEPALIAAQAALNTLNKNNLTELKSFGSPPQAVINVCACVLILFSKGKIPKDRSWKSSKMLMTKVDQFLNDLVYFDKEHIKPETIQAIMPFIRDPEFDPDKVRSKSIAAAGLSAWVINIYKFYEVFLVVEPKQRALREAQDELNGAQSKLQSLNDQINLLEEKYAVIQAEFDKALAEKQVYQDEADKTAFTIDLAHRLVNGLASENIRWHLNVKTLTANIGLLPGDALIIACFISYVGCFTRAYRMELQNNLWLPTFQKLEPPIPVGEESDPLAMISDDAQIAEWCNEGLPSDRMSAENATILTNSSRWPLMIDPQLQGIKWIKQKYGAKLTVIRLTHKNYLDSIEKAVGNGDTLLIENIGETIDAVLDPLIGRVLIKKGKIMKIGDAEIDYNPAFRLILHTKLANPHYQPEIQAQTTLINFTVTRDGLEEQLLAEVVKAERPDLERLKSDLTSQQNNFKITLKILEADLLQRLSSAGDNVLEDPTLVLNLEKTKKTAADIEVKVAEAKITSAQIDAARENYRSAGQRAALLYFILNDLFKVNPIYQFSLKAFTVVFKNAIVSSVPSDDVKIRVLNLIDNITYFVHSYTTRGLFERDKLIFMSQLVIQIFMQEQDVGKEDLDFLLKFPFLPNVNSPLDFLSHTTWGGIKALILLENFKNLDKDIEQSSKRWKNFIDSENPEKEKYPGEWKNKKAIQKLCIMRCLRPDRMTYAMLECIEEKLGSKFVEGRTIEFAKSYLEMSSSTPVFFILSPGVDPLKDVEKLGKVLKYSSDHGNFYNVSLGQGQEVVAEAAIDEASIHGRWVILQNVHLVQKWLATLEKKMEAAAESANPDYRLFISAEPASDPAFHIIPQGILESSIKITNEPPTGMLANLHKALDNFNQQTLEMCSKEAEFKAILFALCYFHAVVAERRKFGPQGWNRVYPFNVGDLTICVYVLHNYLEANVRVPWEDLRYLFGEIMYGGHITDDWDRKLCRTYLEEYMQPDLVDGDLYFCAGFLAPPNTDYKGYHDYIDDTLPSESPVLYGLHPNAEIGFLTTTAERLFKILFDLQPRDSGSQTGSALPRDEVLKSIIEDITDKLPEEYNMQELMARVDERTPFIIVAFQECERMNILVREIRRSLRQLFLGLKGELTITPDMEELDDNLFVDKVPEKWTILAYPSLMGLQAWFADLTIRIKELESWSSDFNLPASVWLAGFFNPQSFLTAIMQQTARKNEWPLDKMCLNCDVTKKQKEDFTTAPREGAYVNGLFMEGARWDVANNTIADSLLKELFPAMPVVFIKAVTQDKQDVKNVYECPVYKIRLRGPTYVWTFNLKSKERAAKWTLAGVSLLLQP